MKFRRLLTATIALAALIAHAEILTGANGKPIPYAGKFSSRSIELPPAKISTTQVRAVWVATVENIDFGPFADAATFRQSARQLMSRLKQENFNTVFFQVRSNCDAWYPSEINPYSRYYSGREGQGIAGIDPLKILIDEAHRQNLEFHAWFNPYRVTGSTALSKSKYLATLSPKNFARRHPELVLAVPLPGGKTSLLLDPGAPAVRQHILDTVMDVVRRYPVDGVHFDDYFYLYTDIGNADAATFRTCNPQKLQLGSWRRNNVTTVIAAIKRSLNQINRTQKRKVAFGISPFGIWANRSHHPQGSLTGGKECYFTLYADIRLWIKLELIDYVVPQLYWGFAHRTAAYAALADWWADQVRGTRVRLITGHAVHRLGTSAEFPATEIFQQLRYNQRRPEISGFALFSCRRYLQPAAAAKPGVEKLRQLMRTPAKRPGYPNCR